MKYCREHSSDAVVICEILYDWVSEINDLDKLNITRIEFEMSIRGISYIETDHT